MTRTTPLRLIILQFSHRFFTDGWTCIIGSLVAFKLPEPVCYSPSSQVVGRELYEHSVPREDPDVMHANPSRSVSKHFMIIGELHAEDRVWKRFLNGTFDFY